MQTRSIKALAQTDLDLKRCLNTAILKKGAAFHPEEFDAFHGHWEVLIRRLGLSGQMSLAAREFYSRPEASEMKDSAQQDRQ